MFAGSGAAQGRGLSALWPTRLIFWGWGDYRRPGSYYDRSYPVIFSAEQVEGLYMAAEAGAAASNDGSYQAFLFNERQVCYQGVPAAVGIMLPVRLDRDVAGRFQRARSFCVSVKMLGMHADAIMPCVYDFKAWVPGHPSQQQCCVTATSHRSDDGAYVAGWYICNTGDSLEEFKAWLSHQGWARGDGSMFLFCSQTSDFTSM